MTSVTAQGNDQRERFVKIISNRPSLLLLGVVIVVVFVQPLFNPDVPINFQFLILLIVVPILPVLYFENKWINQSTSLGLEVEFLKLRHVGRFFILAGILYSLFLTVVAYLLENIFTIYGYTSFYLLVLTLVVILVNFLIHISFRRVFQVESRQIVSEKLFFNSPALTRTVLLYFFMSSTWVLAGFWIAGFYLELFEPDFTESTSLLSTTYQFRNILIISAVLLSQSVITQITSTTITNDFFTNNKIVIPRRISVKLDHMVLLFAGIASIAFLNVFSGPEDVTSFKPGDELLFILYYVGMYVISTYLTNSAFRYTSRCETCDFLHGEGECPNCGGPDALLVIASAEGRKVRHPICPNCKEPWTNLSRRCSNCNYTIVLSCENCSQTINPLWRKCNLCGEPRKTIPEIAFDPQIKTQYLATRFNLVLITIFLGLASLVLIMGTIYVNNVDPELFVGYSINDNITVSVIIGISFLTCLIFLLGTRKSNDHAMLIHQSQYMFKPLEIIFIFFIIVQISEIATLMTILDLEGVSRAIPVLLGVIILIILSLVLYFFLRNRSKSILRNTSTIQLHTGDGY